MAALWAWADAGRLAPRRVVVEASEPSLHDPAASRPLERV
jgi:hypothetical protein